MNNLYKISYKIINQLNISLYKWGLRQFHKRVMPEMMKALEYGYTISDINNNSIIHFDGDVQYPYFTIMQSSETFTAIDIGKKIGEIINAEE